MDSDAPKRRQAAREAHLDGLQKLKEEGHLLYAAAMLNEEGGMKGSTVVLDFPNRSALDEWLETEPYVVGKVWKKIKVEECKVPEMFLN